MSSYLFVPVVAAVIYNTQGDVLLAKRPAHKHLGGLWEFPGGKIELGETPFQALQRELLEELGITIVTAAPFLQLQHNYEHQSVQLDIWQVSQYIGIPSGQEGQPICWIKPLELPNWPLPAANQTIVAALITSCKANKNGL